MKVNDYSFSQLLWLTVLRVLIGWHFLFEGITKLMNPDWTSLGYLKDSDWIFSGLFNSIADNPGLLRFADLANEWGLVLIGMSLIVGLLSRPAIIAGIALLGMYYLSHPPFVGMDFAAPSEGKYIWVDKNLIELTALAVLYMFPSSRRIGLDRLIFGAK